MLSVSRALVIAAAAVTWLPAQAVNKCTMPDGRVVYSDAPCPAATSQAQTINTAPAPRSTLQVAPIAPRPAAAPRGTPAPAEVPVLQIPPPQRVQFSGLPETDLSWAATTMDKIRVMGRDCDWALRVDKGKMQSCVDFLAKMQPRGEFEQINTRVVQVLRQEPAVLRSARSDLRKIEIYRDEALTHRETAMSRLGAPR